MKNLMIISFLLLGSCSISTEHVSTVKYFFPVTWQGYYTKISGDRDLPEEFKVSDKYISYKDKYGEGFNDFLIYQIGSIYIDSENLFRAKVVDSGRDDLDYTTTYSFEELSFGQIEVEKKEKGFLNFTYTSTATYTKTPL